MCISLSLKFRDVKILPWQLVLYLIVCVIIYNFIYLSGMDLWCKYNNIMTLNKDSICYKLLTNKY